MLQLQFFTFNAFQENTYVVYQENGHAWIIDPGMMNASETRQLSIFITDNHLSPQGIFNTHAHIDHVLGVAYLQDKYGLNFHLHPLEEMVLNSAGASAMMFGMPWSASPNAIYSLKEQSLLDWNGEEIHLLHVPGHSPGSIAFYYPKGKWIIAGDALFAGSIGRTDLPGGNHEQLLQSIRQQLFTLPEDTIVYPGHGPATSIGREKMSNPFF